MAVQFVKRSPCYATERMSSDRVTSHNSKPEGCLMLPDSQILKKRIAFRMIVVKTLIILLLYVAYKMVKWGHIRFDLVNFDSFIYVTVSL